MSDISEARLDAEASQTPDPAAGPGGFHPNVALERAALLPPLCLAALLVVLDAAASWKIPLRQVLPWTYAPALLAVAVCVGMIWRVPYRRGGRMLIVGLAVLSVYFPAAELFGRWLPDPVNSISAGFDDWCYQAFGDYLLNNPRGRLAGMSLVDEFGCHLYATRFSSPGLLMFLEGIFPFKDPPMSHFGLGALCLLVHFSAMLSLGQALFGRPLAALAAAFLATGAGWLGDVLQFANYDNLVFIALLPALLGVLVRLEANPRFSPALGAAGGLLSAAMLETYPEGVPLLGVMLMPLAVFSLWRCLRRPGLVGSYLLILILGLTLAWPYHEVFSNFLSNQVRAGLTSAMPAAHAMPGLVNARWLPSLFALGEEWDGASFTAWNCLTPLVLIALIGAGAWSWRRTHAWFIWTALPVCALVCWQDALKGYGYGTYKVLGCASWWLYPGVAAGLIALVRAVRLPAWTFGVLFALLVAAIGWEKYEDRSARAPLPTDQMRYLRDLRSVRYLIQQQPLLLDVDDTDYNWAVYYLRRSPITAFKQRGLLAMPHLATLMTQSSAPPPEAARYVLVEGKRPDAVWTNEKFSVLPLPGAYVGDVTGAYAEDRRPGIVPALWIGSQPEIFRIRSTSAGNFELVASRLAIGPRAPGRDKITLEIVDAAGTQQTVWLPSESRGIPLHLNAGETQVSIRCLETPTPASAGGDPTEAMLLVQGYSILPRP